MPVIPCRANLFLERKEIYKFLLACQQNCPHNCTQFVSISFEIQLVEPLFVLQKITKPEQINFYFENKSKGEAIAAIDTTAILQLEGFHRFDKAQEFIKTCLAKTIKVGVNNKSFSGPHFFCSFSFFDKIAQPNYPFPAATIFLPQWQVSKSRDTSILVANIAINAGVNIENISQHLWEKLQIIRYSATSSSVDNDLRQQLIEQKEINQQKFKQAVLSSLESIHSNNLSKIVLAQALDVTCHTNFNLFQSLNNLRKIHPDCYIFSTSNGQGQNFIGASPERLISIQNQELTTDALAGSAQRGKTATEDADVANRLLSSEKERHEHRVVIDFITQRLYHLGLIPQLSPPRLRQLSNIQHLWTSIQAKVPAAVHPLEIVAELHPTPAVAGAARDVACEGIRRYESFERGLYAAPLGWVDYQGNSEFIVGIRSALIDGDRARLYAGAGIVAGSEPDKELAEIQLKLQALLKALV